jgi:undecaprenyl-phosphate galactose phosphotransferase
MIRTQEGGTIAVFGGGRRMGAAGAAAGAAAAGLPLRAAGRGFRPVRFVQSTVWSYAFLASDLLAMAVVFIAGFWMAGLTNQLLFGRWWLVTPEEIALRIYDFTVIGLVMLTWLYQRGHYLRRMLFWNALGDILRICLFGMLLDTFIQFLLKQSISRAWFVWIWLLLPGTILALRVLTRGLLRIAGLWQRRVLLAGDPASARVAQGALLSDRAMGYEIAGRIPLEDILEAPEDTSFAAMMRRYGAGLLVCAPGDEPFQMPRHRVADLVRDRVDFAIMPGLEGAAPAGYHAQYFFSYDVVLLSYRNATGLPVARAAKVVFDVAGSATLLLLLAPAMLIIAALVRRDGGPVFYAQSRLGLGGRSFGCLKFRSMVMNGDDVLRRHLAADPRAAAEWEASAKLRAAPRITAVGRFLRATSLDELPQLINVLRLEMSLVGPRPITEREAPRYGDELAYYTAVRPGLTGLWQVSGRSDTSYARKVLLDSWYVRNWSFWQDIAILAKTIPAVVLRRGAM